MKKQILLSLAVLVAGASSAVGQLLFTQYYEGPSTNKWYEITNVGTSTVDLTAFSVSLYTNANAEAWKAGTASGSSLALTGTLASGASYLVGNTANTTPFVPASAPAPSLTNNTTANFNGNDSLVLWNDSVAFSTSQIVDVLSFTNLGNEGVDKSFVRSSASIGYNLTSLSNITGFSTVWTEVALATVNSATAASDNYLGFSSVSVPEPSSAATLFGAAALVSAFGLRRRRG